MLVWIIPSFFRKYEGTDAQPLQRKERHYVKIYRQTNQSFSISIFRFNFKILKDLFYHFYYFYRPLLKKTKESLYFCKTN